MVATVIRTEKPEGVNHTTQPQQTGLFQNLNFAHLNAGVDIGEMRMIDAYNRFVKDEPSNIPVSVWLLENPNSPIALPGCVELKGHDYIHLLLNRGMSLFDEAFVVGFTMGNSDRLKPRHLNIYKLLSALFFPKAYKFNSFHMKAFDFGVMYGQSIEKTNINEVDFEKYSDHSVNDVRRLCGINLEDIYTLWMTEKLLLPEAA